MIKKNTKNRSIPFLMSLFIMLTINAFGQRKEINVNYFTGAPNVTLPLYTITSGDAVIPVSLSYNTNGVKPTDLDGPIGLTWQLNAGGEISRELRGLPDDCKKDNATTPNSRLGWLYNTNGTKINSFTIANDNSAATCPDETSDITYVNSNFSDLSDTEPDIFHVNAPGLSCQVVFDNNKTIRVSPYQDLSIVYATDASSGLITSFTITNDKGIKYEFSVVEPTTMKTSSSNPTGITYFKRKYDQFSSGITFNSSWKLKKITDLNGNYISLDYDYGGDLPGDSEDNSSTPVITILGGTGGATTKKIQYLINSSVLSKRVAYINCSDGITLIPKLTFSYTLFENTYTPWRKPILNSVAGFGKTYYFSYADVGGRRFLVDLKATNVATGDPAAYHFAYKSLVRSGGGGSYSLSLPDSTSKERDIWGYYNASGATNLTPQIYVNPSNGSYERYRTNQAVNNPSVYPYLLTGASRAVNPSVVDNGSLNKVSFPDGGTASFVYESNDYYDNTAAAVMQGGGIRIKQVIFSDSVNTANNIERNFSYINPSTLKSSGKPISVPVYAFTTPYTGTGTTQDQWNFSTVRSEENLSAEDNTIIYSHVKESRQGAGSTLYEFTNPATAWDQTAPPDWTLPIQNFARSSCVAAGFMKNDINTYPFLPNTNFDFERGLLKKITNYNETSQIVDFVNYSYQRINAPIVITGLKYESNIAGLSYGKYTSYVSSGQLLSQESRTVYDSQTLSQGQATSINYYYTGTSHKLLTQQQTINSDGTIQRSFIKYLKDYNVSTGSDPNVVAMRNLQQFNVNIPVERYFQVERSGVNKTVGAELTKFNTFNAQGVRTLNLPSQSLKFVSGDGIASFQPSTVASGVFSSDPNYTVTGNVLAYDFSGFPLSSDDNNKNIQSVLTDHDNFLPVASISNARYDEIAYNDFNSTIKDCGFVRQSGTNTLSTNSRTGQYALSLEALMSMIKTNVVKNSRAKNYIFSVWINSNTTGNITVSLTNTSSQTSTYTLPFINSTNTWKYYELKVPLTNMSASFTAQFQSSAAILIDDVFFYPETSEIATVAYDKTTNDKIAETNSNGVSKYYTYDSFGRLRFVYDQDKQITLKNTYVDANSYNYFTKPSIIHGGSAVANSSVVFTTSGYNTPISDGLTYTWNFGDGSAPVSTSSLSSPAHTYTLAGSYTVTLTANSPIYGSLSNTFVITITPQTIIVTYNNNTTGLKYALTRVEFYEGATLKYNFTDVQLATGQPILQGNYTVKVYFNKVIGFKSIYVDPSTGDWCFPTSGAVTSPNTSTINLLNSSYLKFNSYASDCLQ
ncbi:PKD domain protein [compost metagenome]